MLKLDQLQTHTVLFLGKTNLTDRLNASARKGLSMLYDEDKAVVRVTFNDETAIIPLAAVASMIPAKRQADEPATKVATKATRPPVEAQASSPTGHVFAGPGKGKTGS